MSLLDAQSRDLRPLRNVCAEALPVFTVLGVLVLLAFHGFGQFCHRQVKAACPDLIVKRVCRPSPLLKTAHADEHSRRRHPKTTCVL